MKKVAVLQSNYIPWKGYFDIINDVDLFLFYDEVQYTKNDWRNRNKILTPRGPQWITLPCGYNIQRKINEVQFNPHINWQQSHYQALRQNYCRAPFFGRYNDFLEYVYLGRKWEYLFELNRFLITNIARNFLGVKTAMEGSDAYYSEGRKSQKLLSLLKSAGTDSYITGPAARNYLDEDAFRREGIEVVWKDYSAYPEYRQLYSPFHHSVSILDLLFNTGPDAPYYIWGHRNAAKNLNGPAVIAKARKIPPRDPMSRGLHTPGHAMPAAEYRGPGKPRTALRSGGEQNASPPGYPRFSRPACAAPGSEKKR